MKKNVYTLIFAFLLFGGMTQAQDILLQSFDDPGAIGNWKNSNAGSYTLSGSSDAVEGTGGVLLNYNLVGDQGWGGSVDMQMTPPGGGVFDDLTSKDGISFWFKVTSPATVTNGVSWTTKIMVNSAGGTATEEWHFSLYSVVGDASGEWVKMELPFSSFAIPGWLTTYDGVLYPDQIKEIQMQIVVSEGTTTAGEILVDNLSSYKAGGTSVGTLLESFDESGSIGSWQNSTAGSFSLTGSSDAVEGSGSVCLDYILIADQSWGGSIDMQFLPDGTTYPDLAGEAGIRFNYKVNQPASVTNGVNVTVKLFINSTGGEEQWHGNLSSILDDASGAWQEAKLPFLNFGIPNWLTTYDGVLYLDQITKIEIQIVTSTVGLETNGNICLDNLTSYNENNVILYDGYPLNNYNNPSTVGSWINSTAGSYTIGASADAAEGDSSVCVSYNLIADQSWGGSVDMQMLPAGDFFTDMTSQLGISFWYKVTEPASAPANLAFTIKLLVESTGGNEEWHKSVGGVLGDVSGEWVKIYVPFSAFAIPNWQTTFDGVLYGDKIYEIQFQIFGQPDTETTGGICFDNLISYGDEEVVIGGTVTPVDKSVKIYPNPVSSRLMIDGLDNIERIDVYSLNGSYLKQVNGQSFVDVDDLRTGFYMLKIYTAKNVFSARFIKQ